MTQQRMDAVSTPASTSLAYEAPNIEASLSRATTASKKVRVVHGANEQPFDNLEGKTVGMVRKSLREVFNIPNDAEALIGGKSVSDDFVLEGGMALEFIKEAGVKGTDLLDLLFDFADDFVDTVGEIVEDVIDITANAMDAIVDVADSDE